MKRSIKALSVILLLTLALSGASAAEKMNKSGIKTVDNYVAVFDFDVRTIDKDISRSLAEKVIHVFSESGKYEVIDRGNMNKILEEQKFQMSGCVAQECKVEAGQILGVGKIVNGSVGMVGRVYYLTLQLIDVKSGKVELSAEDECRCELEELLGSTRMLAKRLLGEQVEQPLANQAALTIPRPAVPEPKITNSIGMTFVYIKPGTFMMGSPSGEQGRDSDETLHEVTLTRGYYIGVTEATVGQWRAFARDSGYKTEAETGGGAYVLVKRKWEKKEGTYWDNPGFAQTDNHPVTCVSWNDVQEYIKWLNRKEGANWYRLPTEAEWEYAGRAGTHTARFWGEDADQACSYANVSDLTELGGQHFGEGRHNCRDGHRFPAPAASFKANPWGLYDMIGNVFEWVQDWKGDYPPGSVTDPAGPSTGSGRVYRGGSWLNFARSCRSADRNEHTPDGRSIRTGFRLSRTN